MKKIFCIILALLSFYLLSAQTWRALPAGGTNGDVYVATQFGGYLWVAGNFSQVGSIPAQYVARRTTTQWVATPGLPNVPFGFCVYGNELYALGGFDVGTVRYGVMKWTSSTWLPMMQILSGEYVKTGTVFNGKLVVGGRFSSVEGIPNSSYLASFDGSTWSSFGGVTECGWLTAPSIESVYSTNSFLYVGGSFDHICGTVSSCAAKWNGSTWVPLSIGLNTSVSAFMSFNNDVYVCGSFLTAGSALSQGVAKEGPSGWIATGNGVRMSAVTMAVHEGKLYVAGGIHSGSGDYIGNCGYTTDGTNWVSDNSGISNASFELISVLYDDPSTGALYSGGDFNTAIGDIADYVAYQRLIPLPITLSSFAAQVRSDKTVFLKWKDETPADGQSFVVEYSTDGRQFVSVGTVKEVGNVADYSFTYAPRECGQLFFRLAFEGKYSDVKTVNLSCSQTSMAQIGRSIWINALSSGVVHIYTPAGQEIANLSVPKGTSSKILNLPHGFYVARFVGQDGSVVTQKLIF